VHSLPLTLHRPFTTLFWDSPGLRVHSSGLWGSVSPNKIPNFEQNAVNKQNRVHNVWSVSGPSLHFVCNSLHHLGYGLPSCRLSGCLVDIHTLIRCTMPRGRLHRIPNREKAELQTLRIEKP